MLSVSVDLFEVTLLVYSLALIPLHADSVSHLPWPPAP